MNIPDTNTPSRRAAMNGLAVVGFVALVGAGMWLAVYSARYVPEAVSRVGAAAVSLGSIFVPAPSASLAVVPNATSTEITLGGSATTTGSATLPLAPSKPVAQPAAGAPTSSTIPLGGTGAVALYGLPDLTVSVTAVGYLATSSTSSFVAATTVPHRSTPAIKFTVKNIGTNTTGAWRFSASLPTSSNQIYQSIPQQSLNPGDYVEYTLGFTEANAGANRTISVTVNYDRAVSESNLNNDSVSAQVTILGS